MFRRVGDANRSHRSVRVRVTSCSAVLCYELVLSESEQVGGDRVGERTKGHVGQEPRKGHRIPHTPLCIPRTLLDPSRPKPRPSVTSKSQPDTALPPTRLGGLES